MADTEYNDSMAYTTWLVVLGGALRPIHNFEFSVDQESTQVDSIGVGSTYSVKTGTTTVEGSFETVGWPFPTDRPLSYTTPVLVFVNQHRRISVHDATASVDCVSSRDSTTRHTVSVGGSSVSIENR